MPEPGDPFNDTERSEFNEEPKTLHDLYLTLDEQERQLIDSARAIADQYLTDNDIPGLKKAIKINKGEERFPLYDITDKELLKKISKLFSQEVKEKITQNDSTKEVPEIAQEFRPELLSKELPVMIHRWFPDGEGWAYSSSLSLDRFVEIARASSKMESKDGNYKLELSDNQWLVYTIRRDVTSKDPRAINRGPHYLAVAIIDGPEPADEKLKEIYRQLKDLPEAEQRGISANLKIGGKK